MALVMYRKLFLKKCIFNNKIEILAPKFFTGKTEAFLQLFLISVKPAFMVFVAKDAPRRLRAPRRNHLGEPFAQKK